MGHQGKHFEDPTSLIELEEGGGAKLTITFFALLKPCFNQKNICRVLYRLSHDKELKF